MTVITPNPTLAAFDSGAAGARLDTDPIEVVGAGNWSGPGVACVTIDGHLRTRPAA